ncbi:MAG TPA: hypothetical protein VGB94_05305 [Acidobacteriaceae bacterium]
MILELRMERFAKYLPTTDGITPLRLERLRRTALLALISFFLLSPALIAASGASKPVAATPWYMKATEMTSDGRLTFLDQPWWPRAKDLTEGQSFTLDLNHDGRPDTMITRKDGNIVEAIDDSGHASDIWNIADTAYVVSYKGTGIVDRMVVYTDNNQDGKGDEMEIRYYKDGYLRYAWFGENYDNDGEQIFHLTNWQYDGKEFDGKFRGNVLMYINKYDPTTRSWVPLSECPFAFYDPNHDGLGEIVLRAAVQPIETKAFDNANSYSPMWQEQPLHLPEMSLANVRLSYNIDPEPRHDALKKPHYNFGFTMEGNHAYDFTGMRYTNHRRRFPQTVIRLNWKTAVQQTLHYQASVTGFSWDEARDALRWEGQFWIYERRIITNTGGPTMRWNMRREYLGSPSSNHELYYSGIDKRYHMRGASEMWIEVGHVVGDSKDLEIRAFDTNHDGYLDTWEVYREDQPTPVRVTTVLDPKAKLIPLDRNSMMADYNNHVLPNAIAEDEELIAAMKQFTSSPRAEEYVKAAVQAPMLERRRYCLDVARELYFLQTRDTLYSKNASTDYPALPEASKQHLLSKGPVDHRYTMGDTLSYWEFAGQLRQFVQAYGEGRYQDAKAALQAIPAPSKN